MRATPSSPARGIEPPPDDPDRRNAWLLSELTRPAAYPRPVEHVEARRTLVSLLFFAGDRVYKLKQAVDLGFVDATTLEKRRALCVEELRLNAPLAPGVHLGVVPVRRGADGHLVVGAGDAGEVVEYAVEMVRLPAEFMLARRLELGVLDNAQLNVLVELLVRFHGAAATGPGVDEFGTPAGLEVSLEENFDQLAPFVHLAGAPAAPALAVLGSSQHVFLRRRARGFLVRERGDLLARVAAGRIREGHGDLHAENVCALPQGFVLYDRIEFNRRFRCLDVANDLAFLAMDLDARGYPGFAGYLAHRYAERTHDPGLEHWLAFYKGYRALVRAKVAALSAQASGLGAEAREDLRRAAMRYVQLALGYELGPTLVLLAGLPASGKTYLAPHLARALRAPVFHSDERRKRLAGIALETPARADWGQGLYTPAARQSTYRSLLDDAVQALRAGRSVVVDASFAQREFRRPFVDAAVRLGLPYVLVHLRASEPIVRARLAARAGHDASDADFETYLRARTDFEAPDELPGDHVLALDTDTGAPEDHAARVFDLLVALAGS